MVRYVDLERTDVTVKVLDWIDQMRGRNSVLGEHKVMMTVGETLKEYKETIPSSVKSLPTVTLNNKCRDYSKYDYRYKNIERYPSYYDEKENSVVLCTNIIRDTYRLRENVVREMLFGVWYNKYIEDSGMLHSPDEKMMIACMRGCKESLKMYVYKTESLSGHSGVEGFEEEATRKERLSKMTFTCGKYMFRHRHMNRHKYPPDVYNRFVGRLSRDLFDMYYHAI